MPFPHWKYSSGPHVLAAPRDPVDIRLMKMHLISILQQSSGLACWRRSWLLALVLILLMPVLLLTQVAADNALGIPDSEYDALVALYNATDGPNWTNNTNWLSENTPWYGVTVEDGHVDYLGLADNNLSGNLPPELGDLRGMHVLDLSQNHLTGPIPPELADIPYLNAVYLGWNQLSGPIPTELCTSNALNTLHLAANQLGGTIPTALGENLELLDLSGTGLTGTIPSELGDLLHLQWLRIGKNQLTGAIPVELGRLGQLKDLSLDGNQLNGQIPTQLGDLVSLSALSLSRNQLTGPIPQQLGNLTSLLFLGLTDNHLTGEIPSGLGNLANLRFLYLDENQLSGAIPPEIGDLANLQTLKLNGNVLAGEVPASLVNLTQFWQGYSDFSYNALFSSDPDVRAWLDQNVGDWHWTQTVPPSNMAVYSSGTGTAAVSWNTIPYDWHDGYYEVGYSATAGGPYTFDPVNRTADKKASSLTITGLDPGQPIHFVVRAVTLPHGQNQSTVTSTESDEAIPASNPLFVPSIEYDALVALYNSTDGPNWMNSTNWLTENTPWYGVTVEDGHVSEIHFWYNGLAGSIPSEIGNLGNLRELDLCGNELWGSIPAEIGNAANLEGLRLDGNQLSGSIPSQIGNLTNLHWLYLGGNQLSGSIPSQIGNLTNLHWLYLGYNQLSGAIPSEIGNMANLRSLGLGDNQLSGAIPPWIGNLANLEYLGLDSNQLSGAIPPEIGNLANLRELRLWGNELCGSIPADIGNLADLQKLWLGSNQLLGSIPPQLGDLSKLQELDLAYNELTGAVPAEIGNLANLQYLRLFDNHLSGPIPEEIGNLSALAHLDLGRNQLAGDIPASIGDLVNLENLYLDENTLEGVIPDTIRNLANVRSLDLGSNQLAGTIPAEIGNLTNLQSLYLHDNQLSGPIPVELSNLANLTYLYLYNNQLTGTIPAELGNLANLQWLDLGYNQLSGPIPAELGNLANLQSLDLGGNQITGEVPASLPNLSKLGWGSISYNALLCTDPTARAWLDSKFHYWQQTQTVPPSDVGAYNPGTGTAVVIWTPIAFRDYEGYYEVGYGTTSGGPYTFDPANRTADKTASSLNVTGLVPGQHVYFVVRTVTLPHEYNQSMLVSVDSAEAAPISNPLGLPDSEYDALVALYNATDGPNWTNNTNWLTGNTPWYGVAVDSGHVVSFGMAGNNLNGSLPQEIGNLTRLQCCILNGNRLSGEIPASIINLTGLGIFLLHWNCLSSSDAAVRSFLDTMSVGWEYTQTVPPINVQAVRRPDGAVLVSWDAISYTDDAGYYEVGCSQTPGGPYTFSAANRTESKWDDAIWITGLDPGQPVYLVVRTVTLPHESNRSTLVSECSEEITPQTMQPLSKMLPDGTPVWCGDAVITAAGLFACYVESRDRTWGIAAVNADGEGGFPDPGTAVEFGGVLRTSFDGERYVEVVDGSETGTVDIAPLCLTSRALGGGDFHFNEDTGAGQRGVTGGKGINNVGLLVKTCGTCTYRDPYTFELTDGSGATVICCSFSDTVFVSPAWQQVAVTGVSSMWKIDESYERVLWITDVQPIDSAPSQGITGRWEMTSTSGTWAGVHGMLLVQEGTNVTGSIVGSWLSDGQMNGQVFTTTFVVDVHTVVQSELTLNGDTLSGTWTVPGRTWEVEFHRVSPDPISPYAGRPRLLSATCNGSSIDMVWDRPINGYDFRIVDSDGQSIAMAADEELRYDPATYTYRIILDSGVSLNVNAHYTVYLESNDWSSVNWHDPYGVAAWQWEEDAYSFEFVYQPPAPGSKLAADGDVVSFTDFVITATFPDCCYIENDSRTLGLRVQDSDGENSDFPDPGTRVFCYGTMRTNEHGERYLEVIDGDETGAGSIKPLALNLRALGGGSYNYDPFARSGQMGVSGGKGLNNIGLLVKTCGACTYVDPHTFTVDDGSGVEVTCVTPPTILASTAWQQVIVTGISSIRQTDGTYERLLRVTAVDPVVSAPPEGITGRWEMTNTSGLLAGAFGALLVQQGSTVAGGTCVSQIIDGQMNGNVFTATFLTPYNGTVESSMTLDGDTASGTWTYDGGEWSLPVTYHRISPDPVSPYVGRPRLLSATCDGLQIHATWDRPINGWDYDICDDSDSSIVDWDAVIPNNTYNPDTHTYSIAIHTTAPMVPGAHYTVYLESQGGDSVIGWHDPYGVAAWQDVDECYTFQYIHEGPPPPP